MNVGILGSGDVAKSLAGGFVKHGHAVTMGTRDASKLSTFASDAKVAIASFSDAARAGEIVLLALSGGGTENGLDLAGRANFRGKIVLDATNPLDFSTGMPPGLFVGTTDSLGERVQRQLPDAKVVKCFNTVTHRSMIDPKFSEPVPMLICGNDAEAKRRTGELLQSLGWPGALDVGDITGARWLEALVPLWVRAGVSLGLMGKGSWAFKVVT
ncbi:MAG: NADPH-dependent F420 reductase [Gemmatimonadales bacterium]